MYKKTILIISVLLISAWFWAVVKPWLYGEALFAIVNAWIQPLIALTILSSLVAISFLLIKERWLKLLVSVLSGLPFFAVFGFNYFYLIGFGALVLIHLGGSKRIGEEAKERTKINTRVIMRRGLPLIITPLLILISFGYFFSPKIQAHAEERQLPPTVKQVIRKTVSTFLGDEIGELPEKDQEIALDQLINQVTGQFTEFVGPYFEFMPPVLAFGLFLVLTGLSTIFIWGAIGLAMILVWVFRKTGLIQIKTVTVQAEKLEF